MYSLQNNRKLISLLIIPVIVFACQQQQKDTARKTFYDFDSLVNAQVTYLSMTSSALHKEASIDDTTEVVDVPKIDSAAWAEELDIFRQLDLVNKPIFRADYVVRDGLHDTGSNLLIREITSSAKEVPLPVLKIYYEGSIKNVRKIEGLYNEKNALYSGSRYLSMELNNVYNKTILTSYSITGGQKMIMGDSVQFKIMGTITHAGQSLPK